MRVVYKSVMLNAENEEKGKAGKKQKRKGVSVEQHEEHVVSIVASLLKNCRGSQKQRILSKFTEADHEKVRLEHIWIRVII